MNERLLIVAVIVASAALLGAIANVAIRRRHQIGRIDPLDIEPGSDVVVFTSPYCHGCSQWIGALEEIEVNITSIDISKRPDAAARYRVSSTPQVASVAGDGTVLRAFHHHEPRRSDLDQIIRLARS